METRHPLDGQFGREYPVICNHCEVVAAWCRNTLKMFEKFLRFFVSTIPYGKMFTD